MSSVYLDRFRQIQKKLLEAVDNPSNEKESCLRRQYHPLLSPIGWHIGHCVYVEAVWIRGCLLEDYILAKELESIYQPEFSSKTDRLDILPDPVELTVWAQRLMHKHAEILDSLPGGSFQASNLSLEKEYIIEFLINHHAQHLETIAMVEAAKQQINSKEFSSTFTALKPRYDGISLKTIPGGTYEIGSRHGFAYDNEVPQQTVTLRSFKIAELPVDNSQFLTFVEDGGYQNRSLWSDFGWRWRTRTGAQCPPSWHMDLDDGWWVQNFMQPDKCAADWAVTGLTYFEASAFAVWAGLRLVHEYEWEVAANLEVLSGLGEVWEWCSNIFHPYHGFSACPYREYSVPWFDQQHYVLRGGSRYTEPEIRRTSFRNYYLAGADYLFSGIRLAE